MTSEGDGPFLVFRAEKSEPPVVVEKPLKGKQAALYDLIESEAPVTREAVREITISEGIFENSDQFNWARTMQELQEKRNDRRSQ